MLGTLAAISFGLRASTQGARSTLAVGYCQKIVEIMMVPGNPFRAVTASGTASSGVTLNPIFGGSYPDVNDQTPLSTANSATWRPLYDPVGSSSWLQLSDWIPSGQPAAETSKFINDSQAFSCSVYLQKVVSGGTVVGGQTIPYYGAYKNLVFITVSVRWSDKNSMKMVQTQAVTYGSLS